jgi:hypothetical protein
MTTITEQFQLRVNSPSDINQHLETIKNYASECEHITEMGVRSVVSTWAFLASKPKRLVSMDIVQCPVQGAAIAAKNEGIDFEFIIADTSNPQLDIEPTDLLFIDTCHVYDQLKKEFQLHSNKVKKYIILHDTTRRVRTVHTTEAGAGGPPANPLAKKTGPTPVPGFHER